MIFVLRPFLVDRGADGVVVVDGDAADLDLPSSARTAQRPDLCESARLLFGLHPRAEARFDEILLTPGTEVTVIGLAMLDLPGEPSAHELGFRDAPPPRLRVTGSRAHPLTISRAS